MPRTAPQSHPPPLQLVPPTPKITTSNQHEKPRAPPKTTFLGGGPGIFPYHFHLVFLARQMVLFSSINVQPKKPAPPSHHFNQQKPKVLGLSCCHAFPWADLGSKNPTERKALVGIRIGTLSPRYSTTILNDFLFQIRNLDDECWMIVSWAARINLNNQ